MSKTEHTPAYVVKYTAIGNPIPDEFNPAYNAGYEKTEHCQLMQATEDEIMERFAGTETEKMQIIGPLTGPSADLLRERDELKTLLNTWIKEADLRMEEREKYKSLNSKLLTALKDVSASRSIMMKNKPSEIETEEILATFNRVRVLIAKCEGRA